ncbi:NAD(P)H-dependent oxidoreductase [Devosia faecipullorum]|uniref:NAD(P)H-dependent oxidoreductase n=1 Tax=Devosia faecipullorum TaxID=2755039 RepID=UPI00187BA4A2|nr:SAF domain-containing protein [Devosia faecipullorum]MBE7731953.1 NAD(P)-dependent oxidoreductase [Devosia faecipullorum]
MIIVDTALAKAEAEGRPIRVALIGAGFMGKGVARNILTASKGIRLAGIASRQLEPAFEAYRSCGREPVACGKQREIEAAIASDTPLVTEDAVSLARADGIDLVFEITGSIEHAANVVQAAIEAGKHVVQMNAELDGTVGPILKRKADAAGVIYSFSDGDQPGVEMNLFRFVTGLGVRPVLCGNVKGLHDPRRNPTTQEGFARKWGQKPAMVASFADGTKISFEQAVVANGTGMRVARRGMLGPDYSGGDPNAPLVQLDDTIKSFAATLDAHLAAGGPGIVDYVVGARPGPGIFVIGTTDDPFQQQRLNLYKLGAGPYYCFYTPYHLCHFEAPASIGRAALLHDAVLAPRAGPEVGVIAIAKQDLNAGDEITEFGGYHCYGVAENHSVIRSQNLLPIGLAIGARVNKAIARDTPLTWADVDIPPGRTVDALYAEQERVFA